MRKAVLIALTILATVVTALIAAPPFKTSMTLSEAASMMTRTAVIVSVLFVWAIAAIVVTLMSGREIRYSSIEVRTDRKRGAHPDARAARDFPARRS